MIEVLAGKKINVFPKHIVFFRLNPMYHNFKNLLFAKADNENMHFSRNKKKILETCIILEILSQWTWYLLPSIIRQLNKNMISGNYCHDILCNNICNTFLTISMFCIDNFSDFQHVIGATKSDVWRRHFFSDVLLSKTTLFWFEFPNLFLMVQMTIGQHWLR